MFALIVTPESKNEIEALKRSNIDAAADALVLLEELADDQHMLDELCLRGNHYAYRPPFEVYPFEMAQRRGFNIFILKYRDEDTGSLHPYRIFIGFDAQRSTYYVLSIAHRDVAYDDGGDACRSLFARYQQHGIPTYR